jgi:N-acetylmuramoyl-L-alanine amidase
VEVDLDRQIAFVIDGPGTTTIIGVSSGSGRQYTDSDGNTAVAYTPTGPFTVEEKDDGPVEAPLGTLYRPLYFHQGWAVHGSSSVPGYPASHGCVRVSDDDQDFLFPIIPVGAPIEVYGTSPGDPDQGSPGF